MSSNSSIEQRLTALCRRFDALEKDVAHMAECGAVVDKKPKQESTSSFPNSNSRLSLGTTGIVPPPKQSVDFDLQQAAIHRYLWASSSSVMEEELESAIDIKKFVLILSDASEGCVNEDAQKVVMQKELEDGFCGTVFIVGNPSSPPRHKNPNVSFVSKVDWASLNGKVVFIGGSNVCSLLQDAASNALFSNTELHVVMDLSPSIPTATFTEVQQLALAQRGIAMDSVSIGKVPLLVHGVGIYYRDYFGGEGTSDKHWYHRIVSEHALQQLTESTKPGTAHRTGIYLTPVLELEPATSPAPIVGMEDVNSKNYAFHFLRCSSNLSGPTANFGPSDTHIVNSLNDTANTLFSNPAPLNHVLAQNYHNTARSEEHPKDTKATIKAHADKTKDMPSNGLMAFVTFYDRCDQKLQKMSRFDYGLKGLTGLTKLHFRLKEPAMGRVPWSDMGRTDAQQTPTTTEQQQPTALDAIPGLVEQFTVTLFSNSVFLMPLTTNRLYTHEIRSSALDAKSIPTRLGYVVRCSKTLALHQQHSGNVLLCNTSKGNGVETSAGVALKVARAQAECGNLSQGSEDWLPLQPATAEGMKELRSVYAKENATTDFIRYGPYQRFLFSMNQGDYKAPIVHPPFRCLYLDNYINDKERVESLHWFTVLQGAVHSFGDVTNGRKGQTLVRPRTIESTELVPLVRTTTKYDIPSQRFAECHTAIADLIARAVFKAGILSSPPTTSSESVFNNILIEVYNKQYTTMGFHSDQALDLDPHSHIALFSCYRNPNQSLVSLRKLVIESKTDPSASFEIPLLHGSVVFFSTEMNKLYRHKIVLATMPLNGEQDNEWLGLTLRKAKTFVAYPKKEEQQKPQLWTVLDPLVNRPTAVVQKRGVELTLATEVEGKQFYRSRRRENEETNFDYENSENPVMNFTISPSDIVPPS